MSKIEMPKIRATLYGLCRKMLNGIKRFSSGSSPAIELKATSPKSFTDDFSAATGAEDDFQAARAAISLAIDDRKKLEKTISTWIGDAKTLVFRKLWGPRWSVQYAQIGFKNGSIEIPAESDKILEVLRGIGSWLGRNSDSEITTKDVAITSVKAGQLETALEQAINAVESAKVDADNKEVLREKAEEQLKGRIRLVAEELDFKLDDMDPRWLNYGLDKPGETVRPAQVTGLAVTLPSPTHVHLVWAPSERAVRFKVRGMVIGKDTEMRTLAEVFEEQADFSTFAPGDMVKFEIVAVNVAGDSAPSEQVSVTLPLAAAA